MQLASSFVAALIAISALLVVLLFATAARKALRSARDRRRARIEAEVRPLLLSFLAEDEPDPAALRGPACARRSARLPGQRRRWSQGLAEVLWTHRRMMFSPRYGRIGLVTLPYYLAFELLGLVNMPFALVFAGVAFGYGMFVSVSALAVEAMTRVGFAAPEPVPANDGT